MSTAFSTFLQSVLLEAAIDGRIPSGVLNISDDSHRMVIAEKLLDRGIDPTVVLEVVNKMALKDGKYPDRQAYNKEGWLVTFPTPEHRAAAIKKKTHFASDPTHGQGGMNLYYKRKGKQARQQHQDASETDSDPNAEQPTQQSQEPQQAPNDTAKSQSSGSDSELPAGGDATTSSVNGSQDQSPTNNQNGDKSSELPAAGDNGDAETTKTTEPDRSNDATAQTAQTNKTPPAPTKPDTSALVRLTQEFARSKQWTDTPYGDWNDSKGQHVAVTALDGQVVPIRFTDREELKDFAKKRMTEGISLREMLYRADT